MIKDLHPAAVSFSNSCKGLYRSYIKLLDEGRKFHDKLAVVLSYSAYPQLTKIVIWFDENENIG